MGISNVIKVLEEKLDGLGGLRETQKYALSHEEWMARDSHIEDLKFVIGELKAIVGDGV
jgi:hypothetical protein